MAYFAFPPVADVSVTAIAPASPVQTGATFSYSAIVSNDGPDAASSVTLSIPAHAGIRFSAIQQPVGWTCTTPAPGAFGAVSCAAASLAPGVSATFVITASLDCTIADQAVIVQGMSAGSVTLDSAPDNNLAEIAIIAVNPPPTISGVITPVVVSPLPGAAKAGAVVSEAALGSPSVSDNCGGATLTRSGVPIGNLFPVGLTTITYVATDMGGATATASATVHVYNATESLGAIAADLETILAGNPRPALRRQVEETLRHVRQAIADLSETPSDHLAGVASVTAAIAELEGVGRNLLDAATKRNLLTRLTGVSWLLAKQDLEDAVARGGNAVAIAVATALIQQGDGESARGRYETASRLYWIAINFALHA